MNSYSKIKEFYFLILDKPKKILLGIGLLCLFLSFSIILLIQTENTKALSIISIASLFFIIIFLLLLKSLYQAFILKQSLNKNKILEFQNQLKNSNIFLNTLISSLEQGIVVFDRELKCNETYTEITTKLLGKCPKDLYFNELISCNLEEKIKLENWAKVVFNNLIPFSSSATLAPNHLIFGNDNKEPNFKYITINYFPIFSTSNEKLDFIVAVFSDKTEEYKALEKYKITEAHTLMLSKIRNNKKQFDAFLREMDKIYRSITEYLKSDTSEDNLRHLMMYFHTINGGMGLYYIIDLQKLAKGCENEVNQLVQNINNNISIDYNILKILFSNLIEMHSLKVQEVEVELGYSFSGNTLNFDVQKDKFVILRKRVLAKSDPKLTKLFNEIFLKEPISIYMGSYSDIIEFESLTLGKKILPLEIIHNNLKLDVRPYHDFLNNLIHVFRNSIDHGIEMPKIRKEKGKPEEGKITFSVDIIEQFLVFKITDDGSGIKTENIKAKLNKLGIDYSHKNEKELIEVIFEPFFSTRDAVTALSGRGVGMSSVREAVLKIGGSIEINTEADMGTTFIFKLPFIQK